MFNRLESLSYNRVSAVIVSIIFELGIFCYPRGVKIIRGSHVTLDISAGFKGRNILRGYFFRYTEEMGKEVVGVPEVGF